MIISRTPMRISLFGGGTDYPGWYEEHGGAVISATINKYNYIICRYLPPYFNYKYRIRYRLTEEVNSIAEINHPAVRGVLSYMDVQQGLEIQHNTDLPSMSGLGTSSSFTVGLLNSLAGLEGRMMTKRQLALDAIHVEQNIIQENVGSQDQTIAAFGGLNYIKFGGNERIWVQPMTFGREKISYLEDRFLLFFTGVSRIASEVAVEQIKAIPNNTAELKRLMRMTDDAFDILQGPISDYDQIGTMLDEMWQIKRSLATGITNDTIDTIYDAARRSGALGGKLLGAGGGGFVLFYVPPEKKEAVKKELSHLLCVPFKFEFLGAHVVYYAPNMAA